MLTQKAYYATTNPTKDQSNQGLIQPRTVPNNDQFNQGQIQPRTDPTIHPRTDATKNQYNQGPMKPNTKSGYCGSPQECAAKSFKSNCQDQSSEGLSLEFFGIDGRWEAKATPVP